MLQSQLELGMERERTGNAHERKTTDEKMAEVTFDPHNQVT